MDNLIVLDDNPFKRISPISALVLLLALGFPAITLIYLGIDFDTIARTFDVGNPVSAYIPEAQVQRYFIQTALQWSAFSLAALTILLAFTQYRLANDRVALIIGLSILFSSSVEILYTLTPAFLFDKDHLATFIWTIAHCISGLILISGFMVLFNIKKSRMIKSSTLILLSILLITIAWTLVYYSTNIVGQSIKWFKDIFVFNPYIPVYLSINFAIIFFFYPKLYRRFPNLLSNCVFYMTVTQIISTFYLMLLSNDPYYTANNIAYFLEIVVYLIPFSCLITNYIHTYNSMLKSHSELQISQEKLKFIAAHDALTNLYNHREFENLLEITIANSSREYSQFALFVIDIDNFKNINDTLGHLSGDNVIKKFSDQLISITRKGDILARIGGDEFSVITSKVRSPIAIKKMAERIVTGLNMSYPLNEKSLTEKMSVSVGVTIYPSDGVEMEELLKNADIAMYKAKNSGKNTYRFYSEQLNSEQHQEAEFASR